VKTLEESGYLSAVERGLALEQRAIRKYMEPALQNLSQAGGTGASSEPRRR
jgi:hypothetical protein